MDYTSYGLANQSAHFYSSVVTRTQRMRRELDVQLKTHAFNGQDQMRVLEFLAHMNTAGDHVGAKEGAAVLCSQFYLTGQARAQLQCGLTKNIMAVGAGQFEMLET